MFGFPFLTSLVVTMALVVAFSYIINTSRKTDIQKKQAQKSLEVGGDLEAEKPTLRNRLA